MTPRSAGRWYGAIALLATAVLALAPAAVASPKREDRGRRVCNAMSVTGKGGQVQAVREYAPGWATRNVRRLARNGAFSIGLRGPIGCGELRGQLAAVLLADDEMVTLQALRWRISAIDTLRVDGTKVHRVSASQGGARIVYTRLGTSPKTSRTVYRAGQPLWFDRSRRACTSAFVLRSAGVLLGLTAGHCSLGPAEAPPQYPGGPPIPVNDDVIQRLRSKSTTLGSVQQNTDLRPAGPDALVFSLRGVPFAAQQIYRGDRTPHRVVGLLQAGKQRKGRVVCFSGLTSGIDRCGRIEGVSTWFGRRVVCVRRRGGSLSDKGDSGAAVYTRPVGGRVHAVGIVNRGSVGGRLRDMCYTPIQSILATFGAALPTGSLPVGYPDPTSPSSPARSGSRSRGGSATGSPRRTPARAGFG